MDAQRVALVTGHADELLASVCQKLAVEGYRVIAASSQKDMQTWLLDTHQAGSAIATYKLEAADSKSCEQAVIKILGDTGRIDILINNARGMHAMQDATLHQTNYENWRATMATDLGSVFNLTKSVLHGMLESRWGRIVNISSSTVPQDGQEQISDATASAAIHGFTKALALEVANKGITVNTISPGHFRTELNTTSDTLKKKIIADIPVGRVGEPKEVANLVAYLCSEEAAYITGTNIPFNGGQHMH